MPFEEILGHQRAKALLEASIAGDRLHHAYLFCGPEGIGKRKTALILAEMLVCSHPDKSCRPCRKCEGCAKAMHETHPDIVFVYSQAEAVERKLLSKGELDKAPSRDIRISEIRDLEQRIRLRPHEASRKTAIIDPADSMNINAQNALLKTLEEPPASTTIILISSAPEILLPTIRSRCARIPFGPLPLDIVANEAAQYHECSAEEARVLASMSGGSIGAAFKMDKDSLSERKNLLRSLLDAENSRAAAMYMAEFFTGDRKSSEDKLSIISMWYRDVLAASSGVNEHGFINSDMKEEVLEAAGRIKPKKAIKILECIEQARLDIKNNVNTKLAIEGLLHSIGGR